jgi:N-acetyl-anhydromuramyl-L-alanine amidase AmpD
LLSVVNKIKECKLSPWPASAKRNPEVCEFLVLHRSDSGSTPEAVAEFFSDPQYKTGKRMPYHFLITKDGGIFQCVPLGIVAPGAVSLNPKGIQIALDGDFRKKPPTTAQRLSLVQLVSEFLLWKPSLKILGHTESAGTTTTPGKVCPGKYLIPADIKLSVNEFLDLARKDRWAEAGLVA